MCNDKQMVLSPTTARIRIQEAGEWEERKNKKLYLIVKFLLTRQSNFEPVDSLQISN